MRNDTHTLGLLATLLILAGVGASGCSDVASDTLDPAAPGASSRGAADDHSGHDGPGDGAWAPVGPRAGDLEVIAGPDVIVEGSPAESVEQWEREAGVTGHELEDMLAAGETAEANARAEQEKTAGQAAPKGFTTAEIQRVVAKIVLSVKVSVVNMISTGIFRAVLDATQALNALLADKRLFVTPSAAGAMGNAAFSREVLLTIQAQSCRTVVPTKTVPASHVASLVARFGGTPADYRMCLSNPFVDLQRATVSTRVFYDMRTLSPTPRAYRTVTERGGKAYVYDVPGNLLH